MTTYKFLLEKLNHIEENTHKIITEVAVIKEHQKNQNGKLVEHQKLLEEHRQKLSANDNKWSLWTGKLAILGTIIMIVVGLASAYISSKFF